MFPQFRRILLATDLSENSRHAFGYASSLAARYQATIVLVHVLEKLPAGVTQRLEMLVGTGVGDTFQKTRERQVSEVLIGKQRDFHRVNQALAEFCGDETLGDRPFHEVCETVIVEGDAAEEIVKAAGEPPCDLVVLGAHTGRHRGAVVGSVAKRVLRRCNVPVLIVPPTDGI